MSDDSPLWPLVDRYLAGELTPAERERFERWIALRPERQAWVASLRRITRETGEPKRESSVPTDNAWLRVSRRLRIGPHAVGLSSVRVESLQPMVGEAAETNVTVAARRARSRDRYVRRGLRLVGALAASLVLVTGLTLIRRMRPTTTARRYATGFGQRETVKLPDGTELTLGPGSVLTVAPGYGNPARVVSLDGEAAFAVMHDPRHPFVVTTAWATAQDIGTHFVIRAYADDRRAEVAVIEGAVSLATASSPRPAITLRAADAASIDVTGRLMVRRVAERDPLVAWMHGGLAFNNAPLRDAVLDLSRTFAVKITIADSSLMALPVTGDFSNESLDDILDDITAIVGARFERTGGAVVIRRGAKIKPSSAPRNARPRRVLVGPTSLS